MEVTDLCNHRHLQELCRRIGKGSGLQWERKQGCGNVASSHRGKSVNRVKARVTDGWRWT